MAGAQLDLPTTAHLIRKSPYFRHYCDIFGVSHFEKRLDRQTLFDSLVTRA
jgi:hypothetical protein